MTTHGGDALARQLIADGVTKVFGVPGVQLDHAMDGLAKHADAIDFVGARHEQGSAYMADGYARSSGHVGVCMTVPGPGMLNAGAALSTAYACSSPVVYIVGQIPSRAIGSGLGYLHEVRNQSGIIDSVTKWRTLVTDVRDIPGAVHEAIARAGSGRPQPTAVEIPVDVFAAEFDGPAATGAPAGIAADPAPDATEVAAAAAILAAARRPVIWAGWGVHASGAAEQLRRLAEQLGAAVIMSRNGPGALPSDHPLALTTLAGRGVLREADAVLAIGSRFIGPGGKQVTIPDDARLILVNADAADLTAPRSPDIAIHADAAAALEALFAAVATGRNGNGDRRGDWGGQLDAARDTAAAQLRDIQPQVEWLAAIRRALPRDGIVVNDLTQVGYAARVAFPSYEQRSVLSAGYQGTLGYAFPTALGAKVANPDKPVVAVVGDGGFGWCLNELATARQYGIGVVTLVFNDSAFGNVQRTQRDDFADRTIGSDLVNPDYVLLAQAHGIQGYRVDSPAQLETALSAAVEADAPALIEVQVGVMPSPWGLVL